jgi:hypothetical protein
LTSFEESIADAPIGTIWSSSPWMINVVGFDRRPQRAQRDAERSRLILAPAAS